MKTLLLLLLLWVPLNLSVHPDSFRARQYFSRPARKAVTWQKELRSEFSKLLNISDLIEIRQDIPLKPEIIKSELNWDFLQSEIEISSTAGRRIRVILTIPQKSRGPWPAVVCIHGHGGKLYSVYDKDKGSPYHGFASELAEQNFVTIATTVSQHEIFEPGRTLMGERLWDLMRCVDYLESLPEVDSKRIGCGGLSLGGEMAMWLGAMDTRIKATASCGFLTRMDQMEQGHCQCWKFPGLRELVDYADIYSLTAPRALQCQNGLKEPPEDFTVALAEEAMKEIRIIYSDLKHPGRVSLVAHDGAHEINVPAMMTFFKTEL